MKFNITLAEPKHLPAIGLLAFQHRHIIGHHLTLPELKRLVVSPNAWVWVALDPAGAVIGFTSLKLMGDGRWLAYVTASGQKGVGKPLDQHREEFAKSQGASILHGAVKGENQHGLNWRLGLGWQIEREVDGWFQVFKVL